VLGWRAGESDASVKRGTEAEPAPALPINASAEATLYNNLYWGTGAGHRRQLLNCQQFGTTPRSFDATKLEVPVQWWRSVGHTHTAFSTETFVDELAAALDRTLSSSAAGR
jgi:hypothetical protein